jgi:lipoate synthase
MGKIIISMLIVWILCVAVLVSSVNDAIEVVQEEGLKNIVEDVWCGKAKECWDDE